MIIKIKKDIDYVPDWDNNKKEDKPITFRLRYLTTGEYDDTLKVVKGMVEHDLRLLFKTAVISIENLETELGTKKTKIKTTDELLEVPGLSSLYYNVVNKIKTMNTEASFSEEEQVKN